MRELVRIELGFDEGRCLFPNGIVAAHENNAARISAGIELSQPEKAPAGSHSSQDRQTPPSAR